MSGFTPGPWECTATVAMHDRPDLPCVVDQYRLVVAQCWDDGHDESECAANAHLIAAAPGLYDMLTIAVRTIEIFNETLKDHGFGSPENAEAVAKASRAILAKARGDA